MRSLVWFFLLTFLISWVCFAAAAAISGETASLPSNLSVLGGALYLLGAIAPSLVALALAARAEGRSGVQALLHQIFKPPVAVGWYIFAAIYMVAVKLTVSVLHRLVTGGWPPFGEIPVYLMLGALIVSTPVQAGEELGWRGYALPRLADKFGLGTASIILGIIWACWHLPFFFIPASDTFGQSFPVYLSQVTALSVAMAWLYWRTNGSLLPVMLLHAAVNNTKDIVPSVEVGATDSFTLSASPVAWLTVALLWLCALYFLIRMRRADLNFSLSKQML